jgi:Ser/Thr protein kinase RdoA (MazF antagonist)
VSRQNPNRHDIPAIARNFDIFGEFVRHEPFGNGHINDTYAAAYVQGGAVIRYIHQRVNHAVFKNPVAQMENIERVTSHIRRKLRTQDRIRATREILTAISARNGKPYFIDEQGNFWRTYVLIEGARSYDVAENMDQAFEAARAYGRFQRQLVDFPPPRLHDIIPDFHNTPKRVHALEVAVREDAAGRAKKAKKEIEFAMKRKADASRLLDLMKAGAMPERVVHNDTKLNNVLLDNETGKGVCVVDLDTVMPGLALYDFGDMVRSTTSPATEDERDLKKVFMRMEMFEALLRGYLDEAGAFLTDAEKKNLAFAGRLITYEIGCRFLADHLNGDVYFKVHREGHNLDRARTQFKLVESMEQQEREMESLVKRVLKPKRKSARRRA